MIHRILLFIVLFLGGSAHAKDCLVQDIVSFSNEFAVAYYGNVLTDFENHYCISSTLHVTVEHSITGEIEENGNTGEADLGSFSELDKWLELRRYEDRPYPDIWPFEGCKNNICSFGGKTANQQHGRLFLKLIHYKSIGNMFSVTKIVFEDGD